MEEMLGNRKSQQNVRIKLGWISNQNISFEFWIIGT